MDTTNLLASEIDAMARQFQIREDQVRATIELLDEGNTVPFITRYRKDETGELDEEQIRQIKDAVAKRRQLNERKDRVLRSIQTQNKLTPELSEQIQQASSLKVLEDLYLPYRPKKQTLATVARQRGLEPLAMEVLAADPAAAELDARCQSLVNPEAELSSGADVLQGVKHILAEVLSERVDVRGAVRKLLWNGQLVSKRIEAAAVQETPVADGWGSEAADEPTEAERAAEEEAILAALDEEAVEHDVADGDVADAEFGEADAGEGEHTTDENAGETVTETAADEPTAEDASVAAESAKAGELSAGESPVVDETIVDETVAAEPSEDSTDPLAALPPVTDIPSFAAPGSGAKRGAAKAAARGGKGNKKVLAEERRQQRRETRHRKRNKLEQSFHDYFNYSEPIPRLPHYRVLALNRGERCKVLRVKIQVDQAQLKAAAEAIAIPADHPHREVLSDALHTALNRLVVPSIEREIRRELTERAETHAVRVFARNLRKLLLQPPLRGYRVMAVDPGFRSGCKLVALDEFGNVLGHALIHVIGAAERVQQSRARLIEMLKTHRTQVIAIGNGTACRETEQMVAGVLAEGLVDRDVRYLIVNEAGASVYSTSQVGREELPRHDATVRGAVSIGRRALDPLSELVKIDPANIGVGLYQHDLKAKHLHDSLDDVVESCVNFVGVDLNSASPALLAYVSGLNQLTARRVYEHRQQHGPFRCREELRNVPGIGETTFVQAAGFLKVVGGDNPLDSTWIHPESYETARRVLAEAQIDLEQLASSVRPLALPEPAEASGVATAVAERPFGELPPEASAEINTEINTETAEETVEAAAVEVAAPVEATPVEAGVETAAEEPAATEEPAAAEPPVNLAEKLSELDIDQLAGKLGVGRRLVQDIVSLLARPGRDPREDLQPPVFRREVMKLEDLKPGMELSGTVLNVVDFGAFVDIGLTDSGLIHVSRLSERFVSDPHEVVSVGDVLTVWVVDVDEKRRRVSLTAIEPGREKAGRERQGGRPDRGGEGGRSGGRRRPQGGGREGQPQGAGQASQQGTGERGNRGGGRGAGGRQGGRGAGGHSPAGRGAGGRGAGPQQGQGRPKFTKPKGPPKPVVPITDAMAKGQEPMRTFSDLQQFFQRRKDTGPDGSAGE